MIQKRLFYNQYLSIHYKHGITSFTNITKERSIALNVKIFLNHQLRKDKKISYDDGKTWIEIQELKNVRIVDQNYRLIPTLDIMLGTFNSLRYSKNLKYSFF